MKMHQRNRQLVFRNKWKLSCTHLVKHYSHGVNISRRADLFSCRLLWREVIYRTYDLIAIIFALHTYLFGNSKVGNKRLSI